MSTYRCCFAKVIRQHQDSLQRLGTSRVDSLVIHDLDLGYGSRSQVRAAPQWLTVVCGAVVHSQHNSFVADSEKCCRSMLAAKVERYLTELEGGARALAGLRAAGTIKAFGCGYNHFAGQRCDEFARRVPEIADLDFFLVAGSHYTLLDQQALGAMCASITIHYQLAIYSGGRWLCGTWNSVSSSDH